MIVTCDAQKPLALGGLFGDELHIYDKDLACIDEILREPELYEVLRQAIIRNSPKDAFKGPKRTAINRVRWTPFFGPKLGPAKVEVEPAGWVDCRRGQGDNSRPPSQHGAAL